VLALARDADLMIYDGTFTDAEFPSRVGWGHSTWQQGAKLAEAARAKVLTLIHHDPGHDDAFLDGVAADVAAVRPGSVVAREGLTLSL
jgi:ribonuclease BN (tRNA processing enzyme)